MAAGGVNWREQEEDDTCVGIEAHSHSWGRIFSEIKSLVYIHNNRTTEAMNVGGK